MKKSLIVIVALAAIAVFAVASIGAAKSEPELPPGCQALTTADDFRGFAGEVWRLDRWERGQPADSALRAARDRRHCAKNGHHRWAMKNAWRFAKERYYDHRAEERIRLRRKAAREAYLDAVSPPGLPELERIASCESGGDPTAVSSTGKYRGKYQFDQASWEEVGGSGDPAAAPEKEQDERAAALYIARGGTSPWPICG